MRVSKAGQIAKQLLLDVEQLPPGTRLPSEDELAARYEASRATIRQALEKLWLRGRLVRVWGEGTFTAAPEPDPAAIYVDIDEVGSLLTRLRDRGVQVQRDYFDLTVEGEFVFLDRVFSVSEQPALYLQDMLPRKVRGSDVDWGLLEDPDMSISEVFLRYGERVVKEEGDLAIAPLPEHAAEFSAMPSGVPLLFVKQIALSASAAELVRTEAYFDLKHFPHRLVRVIGKGKF